MAKPLTNLYIYLTDACNASCIHCWQSAPLAGESKFSNLKFEECKSFLDSAIEMGLRSVNFSGGEPLLNKDFHLFARYLAQYDIKMAIETNGFLIADGDILNTAKQYGVRCCISLDGASPGVHNGQRGRKDAFSKTIDGIMALEKEKIDYQLIMAISNFNYRELVPLLDWIEGHCNYCSEFKINIVTEMGRAQEMKDKGFILTSDELIKITSEICDLIEKYSFDIYMHLEPVFFSFKNLMKKYSCGGNCGYLSALSILANGNISICSMGKQVDKYIFGHISSIDLKDVWENHRALKDIHKNMGSQLEGICANCIFKRLCMGGCRAYSLNVYGHIFAPNPRCQAYYQSSKFPISRLIDHKKKVVYKASR